MPNRPSQVLAAQLRQMRERRGWTQRELAARLTALGEETTQATIARTEGGKRGVTLDEALSMAAVLGVAPTSLFLPLRMGEDVAITPQRIVPATHARRWIRGQSPLDHDDARVYREAVADEEWAAMQDVSLQFVLDRVQELVDRTVKGDDEGAADAADAINDELARMEAARQRRDRMSLPESHEVVTHTTRRRETREERLERLAAERRAAEQSGRDR